MNSVETVRPSVEIIRKLKVPYALMHTTNLYPTPYHLVRLGSLNHLKNNITDAVIGLSDHTDNNYACLGAVALGASILEKHFTFSQSFQRANELGHVAALDKNQLRSLRVQIEELKVLQKYKVL